MSKPPSFRPRVGPIAALAALVGTAMCVDSFDTTRRPDPNEGSLGQEVFRTVCERVDVGENPGDIDFQQARPYCTGMISLDDGGMSNAPIGPKVRAMTQRRTAIANAIDLTIPMPLYHDMDAFLWNVLPLYGTDNGMDASTIVLADGATAPADEDLLPQTTRSLASLLQSMAASDDAVNAFARISLHQGYRPPRVALGLTRGLAGYSQLSTLLDHLLGLIRDGNTFSPAGAASSDFHTMLDVLRGELANAAPAPVADQQHGTTLDATIDLLFRTDPALSTSHARLLVRRDPFGMPRIATSGASALPAPFVDTSPADGFADSSGGHFIDRAHNAVITPSPFPANEAPDGPRDANGRALAAQGGAPLYQYVDLDQSVLGALLRDARTLSDPANNIAMRFANGAGALLGPRTMSTQDYMLQHACGQNGQFNALCNVPAVNYRSFDTNGNAPIIDTVHAVGEMLTAADIDRILSVAQDLFTTHEAPLARSMGAMLAINDSSRMHPEAVMDPRSNIWDDMMAVATQIAQMPGLLEDVIRAASDPQTPGLGTAFAAFARFKDRVEPDWSSQTTQNASLAGRVLSTAVNRMAPDTVDIAGGPMDNRSVFERFLHLIHDLDGVQLCNKEGAQLRFTVLGITFTYPQTFHHCELIQIDDAAVFYLQTIVGTGHIQLRAGGLLGFIAGIPALHGTLDNIIESQSGITGFTTTPTPQAVNRLVFQPDSLRTDFTRALLDPPTTRDGLVVRDVHPGTIFALELYNFYARVAPLVRAFDAHAGGDHLFVELLSQLHLHYPTNRAGQFQTTNPSGPLYDTMDGAERYEPILVDAFNGDLLAATNQLTSVLPGIDAGGGRTGVDAVASLARVLLDPHAITNLAYRNGHTTTVRSDGTTPVPNPNIYYLFADAMNGIDTAFGTAPAQLMDWQGARSDLVDTFLAVDGGGTSSAQFHNRRIPVVGRLALQWVRDRIAAHRTIGDEDTWARGLSGRLADVVRGPSFAASYNLLMAVNGDGPTRNAVGGLLMDLLDDTRPQPDTNFGSTVTALADTFQILRADGDIDPLLHVLAPAFQRGMMDAMGNTIREENIPITLRFVDRTNAYDDRHVFETVLQNAVTRQAMPLLADEPLVVIGDAIAETHRLVPGHGGPLDANDFRSVFSEVASFFTDGSRGMEQFYYIVQHRRY